MVIALLCMHYFLAAGAGGSARHFEGIVERVVDGDTLVVAGETVRLALVNAPDKTEDGYAAAVDFTSSLCAPGFNAVVDEDGLQTSRSHRRIVALVSCNGVNLNEELLKAGHAELLEDFCDASEFGKEAWAISYGCPASASTS